MFDPQEKAALDTAIKRSCDYLFSVQHPEGYWVAELESNATITAEYIFFMHFMGILDPIRQEKCVQYLFRNQQQDGGWNLFYGTTSNISTTVEVYMALKMAGVSPDRPEMVKARDCIFSLGGIRATRVFTKIFMSLFGQVSWEVVPVMPVEIILLPTWFYFNIYEMSSWSRGTVVPLSVVYSHRPVFKLDENRGIRELFRKTDDDLSMPFSPGGVTWRNFFNFVDRSLKWLGKSTWKPLRKFAMKRAKKWILKHQEPEGDFSGIQPAMFNSLMALKCLGYSNDDPAIIKGLEAVDRFIIDNGDHLVLQACVSPLWDTAITCNALMDAGLPGDHPALVKAGDWMLKKQVTRPGDWKIKNPNTPPGGWAFEFFNEMYPDTDDTAEILMSLHRTCLSSKDKEKECQRALTWLLSMQSKNGGWGAFDQDNDHRLFNEIPFADHGAMLDPPTVDVTGRILWFLGLLKFDLRHPQVRRAIEFIKSEQEGDGCWFGRWGVNYIYGTFLVLNGLGSIGEDMTQDYIRRATQWLISCQNADGGWGETCDSYEKPHLRGQGNSTPSQTGWAMLGLMAAQMSGGDKLRLESLANGKSASWLGLADATYADALRKGADFLIQRQSEDGSWEEKEFTATGFPVHFFIRYHMYRQFFPLMALARYSFAKKMETEKE